MQYPSISPPPSSPTSGTANRTELVAGLNYHADPTTNLCPAVLGFLDKIVSFLRERTKGDHEVAVIMKAEFMTLWGGLLSGTDRILVLGAINRPNDIDSAILRRMPKRFGIGLPNREQREKILHLVCIP